MSQYQLLVTGGEVLDPASGRRGRFDVAFSGGRVAAIEPTIDPRLAEHVESAEGLLVVPGLVDIHTHTFGGLAISVSADTACLGRGTTTAVDAGSAGANSFELFRRVAESSRARMLAWLNLSTIGQIDNNVGELIALPYADVDAAVSAAEKNRDLIVGFKARLSTYVVGGTCKPILRLLRQAADAVGLPVMIHIGDTGEPLPEILEFMRPGDIVSHILTGRRYGILRGDGTIIPEVFEARSRGVLLDAARGRSHVSLPVLRAAVEQGLIPDTMSTDITLNTARDPLFNLPLMATYLLAFGVSLEDCIASVTSRAGRAIRREDLGRLEPGGVGDATILKLEQGEFTLEDADGRTMQTDRRLAPVAVVRDCEYLELSTD